MNGDPSLPAPGELQPALPIGDEGAGVVPGPCLSYDAEQGRFYCPFPGVCCCQCCSHWPDGDWTACPCFAQSGQQGRNSPVQGTLPRVPYPPSPSNPSSSVATVLLCTTGCQRSFAELWRLKVHYRAPPDIRGSGASWSLKRERGRSNDVQYTVALVLKTDAGVTHIGASVSHKCALSLSFSLSPVLAREAPCKFTRPSSHARTQARSGGTAPS